MRKSRFTEEQIALPGCRRATCTAIRINRKKLYRLYKEERLTTRKS